jgi:hypothetical protein
MSSTWRIDEIYDLPHLPKQLIKMPHSGTHLNHGGKGRAYPGTDKNASHSLHTIDPQSPSKKSWSRQSVASAKAENERESREYGHPHHRKESRTHTQMQMQMQETDQTMMPNQRHIYDILSFHHSVNEHDLPPSNNIHTIPLPSQKTNQSVGQHGSPLPAISPSRSHSHSQSISHSLSQDDEVAVGRLRKFSMLGTISTDSLHSLNASMGVSASLSMSMDPEEAHPKKSLSNTTNHTFSAMDGMAVTSSASRDSMEDNLYPRNNTALRVFSRGWPAPVSMPSSNSNQQKGYEHVKVNGKDVPVASFRAATAGTSISPLRNALPSSSQSGSQTSLLHPNNRLAALSPSLFPSHASNPTSSQRTARQVQSHSNANSNASATKRKNKSRAGSKKKGSRSLANSSSGDASVAAIGSVVGLTSVGSFDTDGDELAMSISLDD